ncbi:3-ketoacyl-ACP reductase [Ciceribacter sp. L1K23]|uniref:3-ketoacyl-ACP reductase n=1 Tax=Ciceribacter sp. L1K23 TaxID=2820276 RepID=UPI001B8376CE|nr:3-ketoacyl-ACP reductase [Ciceribacter sp. L1K23]
MVTPLALITGGQQGIGFGIAEALVGAGFQVVLAAHLDAEAPEVIAALGTLGDKARYIRHDLQEIDKVSSLLDRIEDQMGPVTTLVSNAGVPAKIRGDMLELAPDSFDHVLGINLRGTFFLAQEVARRMVDRPSETYRSLIFVTSVSATMASVERAEYCISKAGAAMMAELFAVRLAAHGIGTFELRPGIIATAMTAGVKDKYTARIEDGLVPARRWGEPEDIGRIVVPLAKGDLAFATGAVIPVDGGLSIPRL